MIPKRRDRSTTPQRGEEQVIEEVDSRPRSVGIKLTIVARQIIRRFDQSVERLGLSRAKFRVIAVAASRPGATQRLIAEALEVTEATAGRLIERLCEEGYLERRDNPVDRRAHCVSLAPAAQPVLAQLAALAAVQEAETFAGFAEDELATLDALLDRISRNVANARSQPAEPMCEPNAVSGRKLKRSRARADQPARR